MINKIKLVIGVLLCLVNPMSVQALTCDANSDGVVDRTDIELILRYKGTPVGDDPQTQNVDVNGNGFVDILDARKCAAQQCQAPSCNRPPVANAGSDQPPPSLGTTVVLDGSRSTDPDGDRLTYQWQLTQVPSGSQATLSDQGAVRPTFIVDKFGDYQAVLVVNDGYQNSLNQAQVNIRTSNICPTANAGANKNVPEGQAVALDGSQSTDVDGDPLTYRWSLIAVPLGSQAVLSDPFAVAPSFLADKKGDYQAQLVVNDGKCDSENIAIVTINRGNIPPNCNAGANQKIVVRGQTVTLDGSGSTDLDGDPLTYLWSLISVPPNSEAVLSNPAAVNPTFRTDRLGDTIAQLICNDGSDDGEASTVLISTENIRPVANAGLDQTVDLSGSEGGVQVTLDGSGSSDADGDRLTYRWSLTTRPAGSNAIISDPVAVNPSFVVDQPGTFVAQLIVNDGSEDSDPDTVIIATESRPVANAGPDQTVDLSGSEGGVQVTLDGSGSSDADGDPLTYRWSLTTRPAGSEAVLSDPSAVKPSFVADRSGTYVAQLIVNDGRVDSAPDTVTINAMFMGQGQVSDPAGDSGQSPITPSPDLVSATVQVSGGNLALSVRFAPGTFSSQTSSVQFSLDTDQNPSTGHPGTTASGVIDAGIIGSDFLVNFGAGVNQAEVFRYAGPPINTFNRTGSASPVTYLANGMDVTIPLALLNNDEGRLNFKVTTSALIDPTPGYTGILDTMPDTGLLPGDVR